MLGGSYELHKLSLEPLTPETYDISYTCLLIPRSSSQQLEGDLADSLRQWLGEICEMWNWQVDFLTVKFGYFQWGLRVASSIQIGQFMKEIRSKTSELVISNFPEHGDGSPEIDFWAPGYLVVLGTRPHPQAMIEHYINLVRRQQGLSS